ncbi:MAG TPA: RDD family protein [Candidatus Sulfotelmatobacter sp.]|nr:RDD family protein [Candidatus Sulfotelmatobacter sp.]
MERTVDVRTGEAVAIRYELAGVGSRFLAVMLDLLAQIAIVAAVVIVLAFFGSSQPTHRLGVADRALRAWEIAIVVAFLFAVFFGWFIIFETWWSGRTPGKRALGLRVVRDGGFPVDLGSVAIRNLVRVIEFSFGFYAISALSALISKENKRLGDFAAGTIVVRERAAAAPDLDAYLDHNAALPATGLRDDDRLLIERFLARRAGLEPTARWRLASRIAAKVRPTLIAPYANLDDEALLEYLVGH